MFKIINTNFEKSTELIQQESEKQPEIRTIDGRRTRLQDYPLFMDVRDVAEMTGLHTAACYNLFHVEGCPVYRLKGQAKYVVPRDAFYDFLIRSSLQSKNSDDLPYFSN